MTVAISLAVPGGFAAPAFAQYSARSAESMCRDTARREYGTSSLHGITTSDRGRDRYTVTGHAQRSNETAYFTCKVENGRVRDFNRGNWNRQSSGGGSNAGGAVAAVGAAVLLGAVIAAATSKKKSHEYDRYDDNYNNNYNDNYNNNYAYNNNRPYDDNRYRGERYSPVKGITCYRQQRACFEYDQNYSANWTSHEFGY
jgi:hypothetical protein